MSEVSGSGAIVLEADSDGGIANNNPSGLAIDAGQNIWVANFRGNTISELAGDGGMATAGAGISPPSVYGLDANLVLPFGVALDDSGNVWVTNFGSNTVVMFFGLATPTATPEIALPEVP